MTETASQIQRSLEPILRFLTVLSAQWRRFFITVFSVGVMTAAVSYLFPNYYQSTAILLPGGAQAGNSAFSSISGLASLAGISVGPTKSEQLYPDILSSESLLRPIIYRRYTIDSASSSVDLLEYYDIDEDTPEENFEAALKELRDDLIISYDEDTYIVTVTVATKHPSLSSDVLNALTAELDGFIRTRQKNSASEQRRWIESRLLQVENDLRRSEDSLESFRVANRRVTDAPQLMLEQERLLREVTINSTLYVELKKQLELVKIEEIKNIPIINVLDPARPAAKKSWPKRGILTIVAMVLAFVGYVTYVGTRIFFSEWLEAITPALRSALGLHDRRKEDHRSRTAES